VTSFGVLIKCVPFFVFVMMGLNVLLSALVPSWREKGWTHWKFYDDERGDNSGSWLVALGFAKVRKPVAERDFSEKTALWLHSCLGALLVLIGTVGIIWIAYLRPGE
jgi:hypothetical protein